MLNVEEAAALVPYYRDLCRRAGGPGLSTPQRYLLAVAAVVGAEVIEWVWSVLFGPPSTFVVLLFAVLISSKCLGTGPAWLSAALAAINLAYDVPANERYFGTVAAYVAIVLIMRGSFGGPRRFLGALYILLPTGRPRFVQWDARQWDARIALWVSAYMVGLVGVVSCAA